MRTPNRNRRIEFRGFERQRICFNLDGRPRARVKVVCHFEYVFRFRFICEYLERMWRGRIVEMEKEARRLESGLEIVGGVSAWNRRGNRGSEMMIMGKEEGSRGFNFSWE